MAEKGEGLERLLQDIEQRLSEALEHPEAAPPPEAAEVVSDLSRLEQEAAAPVDGAFEIRVCEDGMEVRATLLPPGGEGKPISLEEVERLLAERGIVFGIDWDAVRAAVLRCNAERVTVSDVVIARGLGPRDEVPASLVLEPHLRSPRPRQEETQRPDWRQGIPFVLVKKGETLATVVPRQAGAMGSDVFGRALAYRTAQVSYPRPGRNTQWSHDRVVAARAGRFVLQNDSFWVNEILDIAGDVDESTGDIDFGGDVVIGGEIKRGFTVRVSGSLYCRGLVEATEIVCGGELVAERGILGRGAGVVRAGGRVAARFIESCSVEADGPVELQTGILNSLVSSLEVVSVGRRGVIAGGRIVAADGVVARQIGTASGTRTEIHCGIDYKAARQLAWLRDRTILLAGKLSELRAGGVGTLDSANAALQERLGKTLHDLNEATRRLLARLDKNEAAAVEVHGSLYPGAYIEICHIPFVADRELHRVRLELDKVRGKVVARPLEGGGPPREAGESAVAT